MSKSKWSILLLACLKASSLPYKEGSLYLGASQLPNVDLIEALDYFINLVLFFDKVYILAIIIRVYSRRAESYHFERVKESAKKKRDVMLTKVSISLSEAENRITVMSEERNRLYS